MLRNDWEPKKYLIRTMSGEPPKSLSPIQESNEARLRGASPSADGNTTLPELIIERVPKRRDADGESAHFYKHLRKRMRKYYRKIFNLRKDDSSSDTDFNEDVYDEYNPEYTTVAHQDDLNVSYVIEQPNRESDFRDKSTLYLGSLSSRNDSSEKERVSVSKSSGSEKRQTDKAHPAISEDGERESGEKSADDEMETEEESDQLGENQEECVEEEESSKEECERNDSRSDQMSKSQDIEEEESELDEKDSDQSPEEVESMRKYNPAPSFDSMCHEAPSDTEENTSLNRFTHRHSLPQNEVESLSDVAPEIQATGDDDELNFSIRTSTPRKSKETGTKRSSDLVHEEETTAKKRYFRNIRLQTDEIEKQVSCINVALQTDCIHVRHFGIQTEETPVVNENVGTQTDLPLGHYRDIGVHVALQKELRSIDVQTDRNLSDFTNVEIQTDGTEVEQRDAETQADLRQEGVSDVGMQTDERTEEERWREDRSFEFFERRGNFFFFF